MSVDILGLIRTKYHILSESQRGVADYILENPHTVMLSSIGDLADRTKVSETTVLRLLRKLNYSSYQVFKVHVAQNLSQGTQESLYDEVAEDDSVEAVVNKVIQSTVNSIRDARQAIDVAELEGFIACILEARNIWIVGVGSSSAIAFDLYHKLLKLGIICGHSSDPDITNIASGGLNKDDLLICISHSGESIEVLNAVKRTKSRVCAITSFENSTLAARSDRFILSSSKETEFRSDALNSRIIQMTFIDMIYISLALAMGDVGIANLQRSREAVADNKK